MKKSTIIILALVAFVVILFGWGVSRYNSLVSLDESTSSAWAQVENVCQRRADLIPNLVSTVQGAANFERNTFTEVVEARAKAGSVQVDPSTLSQEQVSAFQAAQENLSSSLSHAITLTVEAYPELTATQAFRDLQTQLEGCENRIAVERNNYNGVVKDYNSSIRRFPTSIIAAMGGFGQKGYFTASGEAHADAGEAATAPKVVFE